MTTKYKRVMLKLSGEVLSGDKGFGLEQASVDKICAEIVKLAAEGVQVAIVVGAGNFWRGRQGGDMDRSTADHMGMLATTINALALQDSIEKQGVPVRVQSAIEMKQFAEPYIVRKAVRHLEKGRVVVFACGTGNPYFSTDTAAALRAAEISADAILFAKAIDGVYSADPKKDPTATRIPELTYHELLSRNLKVIDGTAASLCMESGITSILFALEPATNIMRAVNGENIGTTVHN